MGTFNTAKGVYDAASAQYTLDVADLKAELATALEQRNIAWGLAKIIFDDMTKDANENLIVLNYKFQDIKVK